MSADVSRETSVPPPPAGAQSICADSLPAVERYAALLAGAGVARGLLGPREVPRLWERHLLNCAVVAPAVDAGARVIDIGSGAGLPGVVWALLRPDLDVLLLEPSQRRADFLTEAVHMLRLPRVRVDRRRAEDAHGDVTGDVVTARAVAPLPRLLGCALPLVRPGGRLLAFKGRGAVDELGAAREALDAAGAPEVRVSTYGEGVVDPPATVVEVRVAGAARTARGTGA